MWQLRSDKIFDGTDHPICTIQSPLIYVHLVLSGIGSDFASSGSLEFSFDVGAVTPACIDVSIVDDLDLEGDHTFTVTLGGTNTPSLGGGTAGFGAQTTTAITIQDPEGTCFSH